MTAAYTVASEDVLVFEAQNTGAISVIAPVADQLLLAVTGPEPVVLSLNDRPLNHDDSNEGSDTQEGQPERLDQGQTDEDNDEQHKSIRTGLEVVNQELAGILREELAELKWPEDI